MDAANAVRWARVAELQEQGLIPDPLPPAYCELFIAISPIYFHDPAFEQPPELGASDANCDSTVGRETWDQSMPPDYDVEDELAQLDLPVLVVTGASDWLHVAAPPVAAAFEPDAQLVTVADTGHFPWIEAPAKTFAILESFLDYP